jgi:predicted phosphoribosyltransferase
MGGCVRDLPELRDRTGVFRDRDHAGEVLAGLMEGYRASGALLLAIPAGGVPVAFRLASRLGLPLDAAPVSKITLPWNSEAGYGAVAFDGTVRLNQDLLGRLGLSPEEIRQGVEHTREKVRRRARELRRGRPPLGPGLLAGRPAVLVDDGLASGFTMSVAVAAVRNCGAGPISVAVPTGHRDAVDWLAPEVEELVCANVRSGGFFAVAEAYRSWSDVGEEEARRLLAAAV